MRLGVPTYGDRLPHDLCHLVVEEMLGISDGFWGLVANGTEVQLIDDQGILVKDGRPIAERGDIDLSDLVRAEEAVALLGPTGMQFDRVGGLLVATTSSADSAEALGDVQGRLGFALPTTADVSLTSAIRGRLMELGEKWRELADGDAITLEFVRPPTVQPA